MQRIVIYGKRVHISRIHRHSKYRIYKCGCSGAEFMANIRENRAIRLYKRECYSGESSPENIRYLPLAQSLSAKGCISLSLSLSLALSRVSSYVTRYIEPSLSNSAACKNAESTWLDNELRSFR